MMLHIFKCTSGYKCIFNCKILYNLYNCSTAKILRIYSTICGSLNVCTYKPCLHFDITISNDNHLSIKNNIHTYAHTCVLSLTKYTCTCKMF